MGAEERHREKAEGVDDLLGNIGKSAADNPACRALFHSLMAG